jgi:hypothetical protein
MFSKCVGPPVRVTIIFADTIWTVDEDLGSLQV